MNENDFVNLSQLFFQNSMSKNDTTFKIKNKVTRRDDKNLKNKHITVKNSYTRSKKFVIKELYFEKN